MVLVVAVIGVWFYERSEMISPMGRGRFLNFGKRNMKVVGFMPTWMVGKTTEYEKEIDEMIFLGVEINEDGKLILEAQAKKMNSDNYVELKNKIKKNGGKNILGIKLFKDDKMDALLASEEAKMTAMVEIRKAVKENNFDGVNLDFEYMSDANRVMKDDFLDWVRGLSDYGVGTISIDVFANTIIKGDMGSIEKLHSTVDEIIVMAYDFYRPSSDEAGPVAPIKSPVGKRNITEVVEKILSNDWDKKKFVIAYPLYGYLWEVGGLEKNSEVVNGGRMVSLNESSKWGETSWDDEAMVPWRGWSTEESRTRTERVLVNGRWRSVVKNYIKTVYYQAYFENLRSLKIKMELAKNAGVGGVAFWALGYEGSGNEVWKMVGEEIR